MTCWLWLIPGWLVGAGLAWAFITAASRPSPEPVRPLDDLADLARVA